MHFDLPQESFPEAADHFYVSRRPGVWRRKRKKVKEGGEEDAKVCRLPKETSERAHFCLFTFPSARFPFFVFPRWRRRGGAHVGAHAQIIRRLAPRSVGIGFAGFTARARWLFNGDVTGWPGVRAGVQSQYPALGEKKASGVQTPGARGLEATTSVCVQYRFRFVPLRTFILPWVLVLLASRLLRRR